MANPDPGASYFQNGNNHRRAASRPFTTKGYEMSGMTENDWKELERLAELKALDPPRGKGAELLDRTNYENEHPDSYEGPCFCATCMSYADSE